MSWAGGLPQREARENAVIEARRGARVRLAACAAPGASALQLRPLPAAPLSHRLSALPSHATPEFRAPAPPPSRGPTLPSRRRHLGAGCGSGPASEPLHSRVCCPRDARGGRAIHLPSQHAAVLPAQRSGSCSCGRGGGGVCRRSGAGGARRRAGRWGAWVGLGWKWMGMGTGELGKLGWWADDAPCSRVVLAHVAARCRSWQSMAAGSPPSGRQLGAAVCTQSCSMCLLAFQACLQ